MAVCLLTACAKTALHKSPQGPFNMHLTTLCSKTLILTAVAEYQVNEHILYPVASDALVYIH